MTSAEIVLAYVAVIDGLSPAEIQALWMSALFGHRVSGGKLAERAQALTALRDRVGKQSAARATISARHFALRARCAR